MNNELEIISHMANQVTDFFIAVAKIVLFIASIPLVFWYLHERLKIEKKLREAGQWPY